MSTTRKSIQDADALLLYQVGPVYCCSPTLTVESVIMPPRLTHPPGVTSSTPGVFKFSSGIVHVVDLRKRFGVDDEDKHEPGRIVVVEVEGGHAGIWVDEIIDVIQFPLKGWGQVPAHIPRNVFSKTLLYDKKIMLYADFESLHKFRETGYLRQHIEVLKQETHQKQVGNKPVTESRITKLEKNEAVFNASVNEKPAANEESSGSGDTEKDRKENHLLKTAYDSKVKTTAISAGDGGNNESTFSHSVIRNNPNGIEDVKGHLQKATVHQQHKLESGYIPKENGFRPSIKSNTKNIKSEKPDSKLQHNYTARTGRVRSDVSYGADVSSEPVFAHNTGKPMEAPSESNMMLWVLVLVVAIMMLVVMGNLEDLFPNNLKAPEQQVLDSGKPDINYENSKITTSYTSDDVEREILDEPAVEESAQSNFYSVQETELYRADISQNKDDVVIVLQQPENEADVFLDKATELNNKITDRQEKNLSLNSVVDESEKFNGLARVDMETNSFLNKTESIFADDKISRLSEDVQIESASLVIEKPIASSDAKAPIRLTEKGQLDKQLPVSKKQVVHIVVKGDTLWHIAKRYIKNPYKYPELARLSKIKNPDLIYPGNRVVIIIESKKNK